MPELSDAELAAAGRDEDAMAQLEGAVADWAAQLAQVLQREQGARIPGTGAPVHRASASRKVGHAWVTLQH